MAHFRLPLFPKHTMDLSQPYPGGELSKSKVLTQSVGGECVPCAGDAIHRAWLKTSAIRVTVLAPWAPEGIGLYTSRILFRDIELRLESSSMKSVYAGVTMRSTEEKP